MTRPEGELSLQTIAMPADTNANGDIFGGWLMAQMDLAGGVMARTRAHSRVATVAVDAMTFLKPVKVGDVVSMYTRLTREGRTSMRIEVEVWITRHRTEERQKVTEAVFTYVSIDEDGRPLALPDGG